MTSTSSSKKLRLLLVPFFATSHIGPFTDLAVRLTTASSDAAVEATVAVTPANLPLLESLLEGHGRAAARVNAATYPFPAVDGLPEGIENLGKAAPGDEWRIDAAAISEALMRPAQEALIRAQSPDAIFTDVHFLWNAVIASELGVPCVQFTAIGAFPALAMRHLALAGDAEAEATSVVVPGFPAPDVRISRTELPEFLRSHRVFEPKKLVATQADLFGLAANTFSGLERPYCDMYVGKGYVKRAYFLGPLSLPPSPAGADDSIAGDDHSRTRSRCIDWLNSKPDRSVVYVCFGKLSTCLGCAVARARSRAGGFWKVVRVGGEGGELESAGGVGGARRGQREVGHDLGSADGHPGASGRGCFRDPLRVELCPRDRGGRRAGAHMADGVRAVHHREAAHGGATDRGAAVA
jgi:hypothetical protein